MDLIFTTYDCLEQLFMAVGNEIIMFSIFALTTMSSFFIFFDARNKKCSPFCRQIELVRSPRVITICHKNTCVRISRHRTSVQDNQYSFGLYFIRKNACGNIFNNYRCIFFNQWYSSDYILGIWFKWFLE